MFKCSQIMGANELFCGASNKIIYFCRKRILKLIVKTFKLLTTYCIFKSGRSIKVIIFAELILWSHLRQITNSNTFCQNFFGENRTFGRKSTRSKIRKFGQKFENLDKNSNGFQKSIFRTK